MDLLEDIYFKSDYITIYSDEHDEEFIEFLNEDGNQYFLIQGLLSPVSRQINCTNYVYYDLISVYGYGGFLTNASDINFIQESKKKFQEFCKKRRIISFLARLHPYFDCKEYSQIFDVFKLNRHVVIMNLDTYSQGVTYNSKTRNILSKCRRNDLKFNESSDVNKFIRLYSETMERNNASNFYYFSNDYFKHLFSRSDVALYEVSKDSKTLSMAFVLFGEEIAHYHLSANSKVGRDLNANYLMLDEIFIDAKSRGKSQFLLGGGRGRSEDDELLAFKKKFGSESRSFYIAGMILDKQVYEDLNRKAMEKNSMIPKDYFHKYRYNG